MIIPRKACKEFHAKNTEKFMQGSKSNYVLQLYNYFVTTLFFELLC